MSGQEHSIKNVLAVESALHEKGDSTASDVELPITSQVET
jgi:hypothetical protein